MRFRTIYFLLAVAFGGSALAQETKNATSPMWGELQPGRHNVAFDARLVETAPQGGPSRPMRLLIWRPAVGTEGEPLRFGDYFSVSRMGALPPPIAEKYVAKDLDSGRRNFSGKDAADLFERLKLVPVAARTGARLARGRFPLVVHSLGRNGYQLENVLLWEYLASHGFVVAVVPQLAEGVYSRSLKFDAKDIRLQADDIVRTVDLMRRDRQVHPHKLFYVGHSSGAVAALIASANRPALALASFDGSNASKDGVELLKAWPSGDHVVGPPVLLQFYRLKNANYVADWGRRYAGTSRYEVGFPDATHFDFQLWPLFSVLTGTEDERGKKVRSAAHGASVLRSAVSLTGCAFEKLSRARKAKLDDCFDRLPEGAELASGQL